MDCVGAQHIATQLLRNTTLRTLVLNEVPLPLQEVGVCPTPRTHTFTLADTQLCGCKRWGAS